MNNARVNGRIKSAEKRQVQGELMMSADGKKSDVTVLCEIFLTFLQINSHTRLFFCEIFLTPHSFLRNNSHTRLFFAKSFSRLPLFCKTIPFLCEIFLTGFPMSSNTIHLVGISLCNRRDAFVLATGNAVTTCAAGAASAAAAVSAADDVVHGTEDVEQGEPNKKAIPPIIGRRGRT